MSVLIPQSFGVADFETTKIEIGQQDFLYGGIYQYNSSDSVFLSDSLEDIVNYFIRSDMECFYFHNLSYDFRFLYNYLIQNFELDIMPYGAGILKISVYKKAKKLFELRDSFALLKTSLKKANQSFNKFYFKSDIGDEILNFDKTNPKHIEYLKLDCLSLYESLINMKEIYNFKKMFLSLAGASLGTWKEFYSIKNIQLPKRFDRFFRYGYYGARTETFRQYVKSTSKRQFKGYDFNSLYAKVMEDNKFPIGAIFKAPKEYDLYDLLEHDFFYAKIKNIRIPDMYIPPLPVRHNNSLVFPTGYINSGIFNSVDIRLLLEYGGSCDLDYGYFWSDSDFIFKDYVDFYYGMKLKAKKAGDRGNYQRAKDMLTNLYGKFAQKDVHENFITLDCPKKRREMVEKGYMIKPTKYSKEFNLYSKTQANTRKYTTTHISSFVTSYGRKTLYRMFQEIEKAGKIIVYGDTDSGYTDYHGFKNIDPYILGALDCEYPDIIEMVAPLPKLYGIKTQENKEVKNYNFNKKEYNKPYNQKYQKIYLKGKGLKVEDLNYEMLKDFVFEQRKINNKRVCVSKLRSIVNTKRLEATECYELSRSVTMNENKRIIGKNFKTYPLNFIEQ
jgi:hypothetical protein